MSRQITTRTEIKDKALAIAALKTAGWRYHEDGNKLTVSSGPMSGSIIDTSTGTIQGDSDMHRRDELGALKKFYSEAAYKKALFITGAQVIDGSREVLKNGNIVFMCSGNFT
jgi:hypothetical protein